MAQAGSLYTSLSLESASFISGLKKAAQQTADSTAAIEKKLDSIVNFGKVLAGSLIAEQLLGIGEQIFEVGKRALEFASGLAETAQQLGVTTNDLQTYRFAATQVGIDQEVMDKGLAKLTLTLGKVAQGAKEPIAAFARLGISAESVKGETAGNAILQIADGLAKISDPAKRAAIEVELFGKAGQALDTLLAGGSGAIGEMAEQALRLGVVLSPEQIAKADNAADAFARVKLQLEANIAGAVSDNADAIERFANVLGNLVSLIPAAATQLARLYDQFDRVRGFAQIGAGDVAGGTDRVNKANYRLGTNLNTSRDDESGLGGVGLQRIVGGILSSHILHPGTGEDGGGGAAGSGHAAADKANRAAEQARKKALERDDNFNKQLDRSNAEYLSLKGQLSTDAREQAQYAHQEIDDATAAREAARAREVLEGRLNAADVAALNEKDQRNDDLAHARVNREEDRKLGDQDLAASLAGITNQRDLLTAQAALATTASARQDAALRLLALDEEEERVRLNAVDKKQDGEEAYNQAQARLAALPGITAARVAGIKQANARPGEAYLRSLSKTPDEIAEGLETSGVLALEKFNTSLDESVKKTLHLHGIFGDIIGDLVDMAIKQAVIKPIAESLFGGGSGGGFLSSLFGSGRKLLGFAAGGRPPLNVPSIIGEKGPELFIPDVAGRVVANDNLRGLGGGSNTVHVNVDARGASSPADVRAAVAQGIAQAAPYLTGMAVNETFRQASRPGL